MAYSALVFVHILSATVAFGSNLTYSAWLARGAMAPANLAFALRGIAFIDTYVANPAYIVLLLTGGALVHFSGRSFTQPWIVWALSLYAVLAVAGFLGYSPALKNQIRTLDADGPESAAYQAADKRQTIFGVVTTALALAIIALMVFKPGGA